MFVVYWYECLLVVLACESLHACTVCSWRCEHARFCAEVLYEPYVNFHLFISDSRYALFSVPSMDSGTSLSDTNSQTRTTSPELSSAESLRGQRCRGICMEKIGYRRMGACE